ncbi:jg14810 [Pararge aegeria aegeria]|uniref:Jg14810 protein n=1 Tax=Pararge aegeria aegeria TaxID=348720 RepID=A0A8S4R8K6_9NEOP|nr:jg14810 [Pararge aegeria aegeria]
MSPYFPILKPYQNDIRIPEYFGHIARRDADKRDLEDVARCVARIKSALLSILKCILLYMLLKAESNGTPLSERLCKVETMDLFVVPYNGRKVPRPIWFPHKRSYVSKDSCLFVRAQGFLKFGSYENFVW